MTPSELLELAKLTGGIWFMEDGRVWSKEYAQFGSALPLEFNPSLTGTAEQKAQALDVIVAASRLKYFSLLTWEDGFTVEYLDPLNNERSTLKCPDILTASAKALIASRSKA